MTGTQRRQELIHILAASKEPISGSALADRFHVSRQVIVQDVALLRASDCEIYSTPRGYVMAQSPRVQRVIKVNHRDDQIGEELNTVVDMGGCVLDVFVHHEAYGNLRAELNIRSRRNVQALLDSLSRGESSPLKNLTSDIHWHTVEAESEEILDFICQELAAKGILLTPAGSYD